MKFLRLLRRVALYSGAGVLATALLLTIAALTPRRWSFPPATDCRFTIYVSGDALHTNLIVPVQSAAFDWSRQLDLTQIGGNAAHHRYLQFGWGDRIWYINTPSWEQINPMDIGRVLFFWQNQTALFVKGHPEVPRYPNASLRCLRLSEENYTALMQFVDRSFDRDDLNRVQRIGEGQDRQSSFYAATGYYSLFRTCNSWTAEALHAAKVNTPLWSALAQPVLFHLKNECECRME